MTQELTIPSPAPAVDIAPAAPAPVAVVPDPSLPPAAGAPAASAAVAPIAAAPAVTPEVQTYIDRLSQQQALIDQMAPDAARARDFEEQQTLQASATNYAQRLVREMNLTPEQANRISLQEHRRVYREFRETRMERDRQTTAVRLAREHGVDPAALMHLPVRAMQDVAKALGGNVSTSKRLADLEAENAALKKRLAPAQTFGSAAVGPDGTSITRDNIDYLYRQDPTRYEAIYRRFLNTGQLS